ncbi:MAG TPA: hypothetical protein VNK46_07290 [Nitrospiraceae bacterium]|nr:hypothetical protein [Nitrospiraceae bacterium]
MTRQRSSKPVKRASWPVALWAFIPFLCLILAACGGPWRDTYLKRGINRLTQEEIAEKLGPPHTAKTPVLGGESVWTYRFPMSDKELRPWSLDTMTRGALNVTQQAAALIGKGGGEGARETLYCYRYVLTFDEAKVLKSWRREDCVPRNHEKAASQ